MSLDDGELGSSIIDELTTHTVLTLATVGPDGPYSTSLMYAPDGFDLFWLSDPATRHSQYLQANASSAVSVARQYDDFREIKGLQMKGHAARLAAGDEQTKAFELLVVRYPFLEQFAAAVLAQAIDAAQFIDFVRRALP